MFKRKFIMKLIAIYIIRALLVTSIAWSHPADFSRLAPVRQAEQSDLLKTERLARLRAALDRAEEASDHVTFLKEMIGLARQKGFDIEEQILSGRTLNIGLETQDLADPRPGSLRDVNITTALQEAGADAAAMDPQIYSDARFKDRPGFVNGVVQDMPFEPDSFSLAVSTGLFYPEFFGDNLTGGMAQDGFKDPLDFYRAAAVEIKRVLKDNGALLVVTGSRRKGNPEFLQACREANFEIVDLQSDIMSAYLLVNRKETVSTDANRATIASFTEAFTDHIRGGHSTAFLQRFFEPMVENGRTIYHKIDSGPIRPSSPDVYGVTGAFFCAPVICQIDSSAGKVNHIVHVFNDQENKRGKEDIDYAFAYITEKLDSVFVVVHSREISRFYEELTQYIFSQYENSRVLRIPVSEPTCPPWAISAIVMKEGIGIHAGPQEDKTDHTLLVGDKASSEIATITWNQVYSLLGNDRETVVPFEALIEEQPGIFGLPDPQRSHDAQAQLLRNL